MKKLHLFAALSSLVFSTSTFASDLETSSSPAYERWKSGFFVGLGGGYNSVKLNQYLTATGVSNIYLGASPIPIANGAAGGPANPFHETDSTFAPEAQIGYFFHFTDSPWLGGIKFSYQYLGLVINDAPIDSPQAGAYTTISGTENFTGNVIIQSSQTYMNHQLALLAFIGRSFRSNEIYFGIGPSLFRTHSNFYHATGYADINSNHTDITGAPTNLASTKWLWGGAAQLGMTHYFNSTWFLDINYNFAVSGKYTTNYSSPFTNYTTNTVGAHTNVGILSVSNSQRIIAQGVMFSINKVFPWC